MSSPLWTPSPERVAAANLTVFKDNIAAEHGVALPDYAALYDWSIAHMEAFWTAIWDEYGVIAETRGERVLVDGDKMPGARYFPDARLNYAENLLRRRDAGSALVFWGEDRVRRRLSYAELYDAVSRLAVALKAEGIGPGDRVAGYLPNMPEAIIAMLATVSLGGVWSSASPDFGVRGVLDRFGQIEPKVLVSADGYFYAGKTIDSLGKLAEVKAALPSVRRTIIVPYVGASPDVGRVPTGIALDDFIAPFAAGEIDFLRQEFNAPLYIMFSSGTTGVPKCIVHRAGGALLQHLKEHRLHCDIGRDDRVFYFTTCGWMMWNWLVSALASEATLLLYDGSPFHPDGNILFDYADAEGATLFGTSAKYIDALAKQGYRPVDTHKLDSVRTITSTGSTLVPEGFDYVYGAIKSDVQLASMSGGTDLVSCFALGNPTGPVWRGEVQCRGLGMAVEVFDDGGHAVSGEKGELVCTKPFPPMPLGFWSDDDGRKYHEAYYDRFPNVWCHGDFVELTEHGGVVFYGRSDATLNPGGVRIGTAEIYRQVEDLDEVVEALVIGQDWDNDVRVVLFVRLRDGLALDEALVKSIKTRIRAGASPRHVPAKVVQIDDIPRTKSGKITELAVRDVVHGRPVKNQEALANPAALKLYEDLPELRE